MPTKYQRQILSAAATIRKKGVQVTWRKAADSDASNDTSPEFPTNEAPAEYKVWMVFYAQPRQNLYTVQLVRVTDADSNQLFGALAGNVKFTPERGDEVILADGTVVHVDTLNITQPDLTPILYEVSFK